MILWIFGFSRGVIRPDRALVDPGPQQTDFFGRERIALLRHPRQIYLQTGDGMDEQTFGALARYQRRPRLASFKCGRPLIEPQVVFLFLRAVTLVTVLGEDRLDVF